MSKRFLFILGVICLVCLALPIWLTIRGQLPSYILACDVLLTIGAAFVSALAYDSVLEGRRIWKRFNEIGIRTEARVTSKHEYPPHHQLKRVVTYEFEVSGVSYESPLNAGNVYRSEINPLVGDIIKIIYLPDNPKKSLTDWEFDDYLPQNSGCWVVVVLPLVFLVWLIIVSMTAPR